MPPLIQLEQVTKIYRMGDVTVSALLDVSLTIDEGEFVAIMGASGSGKSTLMNIIGCLDGPNSGRYLLGRHPVSEFDRNTLPEDRVPALIAQGVLTISDHGVARSIPSAGISQIILNTGDGGEQSGEHEGAEPDHPDVEAERIHAPRLIAGAGERGAERRAHEDRGRRD